MRGKVKNHHLATQVISRSSDMSKYVENQYDILPKSTLAARFEDCGRILSLQQMTQWRVHQLEFLEQILMQILIFPFFRQFASQAFALT